MNKLENVPGSGRFAGARCAVIVSIASAAFLVGCGSDPSFVSPPVETSVGGTAPARVTSGAVTTPRTTEPPASRACTSEEIVACPTGEACARMKGVLIEPRPCFAHAREACASLACTTGCDIHGGSPREVHCAPNASSTGHMKRCGGMAGWQCPEKMRCVIADDERVDDATGVCVPEA